MKPNRGLAGRAGTTRRGDPAYVRGVLMTLGISVAWSTSPLFYRGIGDTPTGQLPAHVSITKPLRIHGRSKWCVSPL